MSATLTIGALARQSGVGIETVRFYEREGLLPPADRLPSGYRQYTAEAVAVLRFIRRAKELGFTLREIKSLLALRLDQSATRADVRLQAESKVADLDTRIADLQRMRNALALLITDCHGDGPLGGCPILETLQGARPASVTLPTE